MYEVKLINDGVETVINAVSTSFEAPNITNGTIKKGINVIDNFSFDIYPNNPGYKIIKPKLSLIEVVNTRNNKNIFKGRVLLPTPSMDSSGALMTRCICESELAYLHDSTQRYGEYHNISVRDFLKIMLDRHNQSVEEYKRFELGIVEVSDSNDSLYRYLDYESTFNMIMDKIVDRLGGELRVRWDNGIRYLDYVWSIGEKKDTEIRLSQNLISVTQEKDPTDIISKLVILGTKLEDSDERLTIESVNNGIDYIVDQEAINNFGITEKTVTFDGVTIADNLLIKGYEYLKDNNRLLVKYKVTAIDLAPINLNIDEFEVGNRHNLINPLMDINEELRIIEMTIKLSEPQNSDMTIGDKFQDIKDYQLENLKTAKEVKTVKDTVKTTVTALNNVSIELNNTVEILNSTNESMGNLNEVVKANVDATNAIANTLVSINNKLDKLTRRINMGV